MARAVLVVLLVLQSAWVQVLGAEPLVPALVIIGDSTVDVGNNNFLLTAIKSNFVPYGRDFIDGKATGRFCNGKIIPDYVAELIGLPYPMPYLDPNAKGAAILTGINTASSASGFYEGTAQNFNVVGLSKQLEWLDDWKQQVMEQVGTERASVIVDEAIYVISTGANDYVNNYYINIPLQEKYNTEQYKNLLIGLTLDFLKDLHAFGARRIAILALPPLGCLPSQIRLRLGTDKCIESLNQVAVDFNTDLTAAVDQLTPTLPGSTILLLDSYTYIYDAFQNPAKYGLKETANACCGTGTLEVAILCNEASPGTCKNADDYLFWDSFHPSAKFNAGIGRFFFETARGPFGV